MRACLDTGGNCAGWNSLFILNAQSNVRLCRLSRQQPIKIQRLAAELQVEKDPAGVSQKFANQSMLIMPQVVNANACQRKALG